MYIHKSRGVWVMSYKSDDIVKFENNIRGIQKQLNLDNMLDSIFITDRNRVGYTKVCEECKYLEMVDTDIYVPFKDLKDKDLEKIILSVSKRFTTLTNLLYNDDCLCHCNNDEYEMVDNEWVYIGDICDLDY